MSKIQDLSRQLHGLKLELMQVRARAGKVMLLQ